MPFRKRWKVDDKFLGAGQRRYFPYRAFVTFKSVFGQPGAVLQRSQSGRAKDALISIHIEPFVENYSTIEETMKTYRYRKQIGDYRNMVT